MSMESRSAYILGKKEFAVLLQAKGISDFFGFPMREIPDSEREILMLLKGLTDKGFLYSDGTEFRADRRISECLSVLAEAEGVLLFIPEKEALSQSFCYAGERLLVCQEAAFHQDALKLWLTDWTDMGELLEENGRETEVQYYKKGKDEPEQKKKLVSTDGGYLLQNLEYDADKEFVPQEKLGKILRNLTKDVEL